MRNNRGRTLCRTFVIVLMVGASPVRAAERLGMVNFPVSCAERVQGDFNRAVALLHHMTYPQAQQAFQQIAIADPGCAMAHWGVAMTLFQPLWPTRPGPADLRRGWEEVQKAEAIGTESKRERLFIEAAAAFFREPESASYWDRIRRWQAAMETLHDAAPDDPEATAFYALSLLAVAPTLPNPRPNADRAAALLLEIYRRNPDHPGAMHYLVHADDVQGREHESLDVVRKYAQVAPKNPHALHMPTHIFTRLGDWDSVIRGNLQAANAALQFPAGEHGEFVWDEFPHAIEYLIYAYLQKGEDGKAAAQLRRLQTTRRLQPTSKTAFHLASTQARYALERRDWKQASQLLPRRPAKLEWDRFPWPEGIVTFARGFGAAHLGNVDEARRDSGRLRELEAAARASGEELFERNIVVLRLELDSWIAHASGERQSSIAAMRQAADLEISTPKAPVTPAPTLPAYELWGDLLMEQNQPKEALAAYRRSLELYPHRFNSLLGAARASRKLDDRAAARAFYGQLLEIAKNGTRPALQEAREYVSPGQKGKS